MEPLVASNDVKGLLIADRPGGKHGGEPAAFVPAGKSEAWGLNPTKKMPEVDRFVPQSVTAQHVAWVQAYDEQKRAAKACEQEASAAAVARKDAFAAFSQKLRQAVLSGQDLGFWRASKHKATGTEKLLQASTRLYHEGHSMQHKEQEGSSAQCQARSAVDAAGTDVAASSQSAPDQTVKAEHRVATPQAADSQPVEPATQPSSSQAVASQTNKTSHRPASRQKASKPAWALSAQEAEAVAAQEESDLLAFAESLDYDAFVESLEDTELSQALQSMEEMDKEGDDQAWRKEFVRALNHCTQQRITQRWSRPVTAMSETARSTVSCARESVVSCRGVPEPTTQSAPQWDSSCAVVKDTSHPADAQSTALAAELLKQAADLKSVHSVLSARAVLSRATSAMGARSQGHTKPHAHVHTHTAPPE